MLTVAIPVPVAAEEEELPPQAKIPTPAIAKVTARKRAQILFFIDWSLRTEKLRYASIWLRNFSNQRHQSPDGTTGKWTAKYCDDANGFQTYRLGSTRVSCLPPWKYESGEQVFGILYVGRNHL